jgi:2-keto-4-pentenoate hydratase/2-oxohepta-3-ene-1,7-dioic acid hydratase in catechol pathway
MTTVRFRDQAGSVRTGEWTEEHIEAAGRAYDVESVDVLPPSTPSKIVCVGLNYADHAAEEDIKIPDRPMLFMKGPNALAGHGDTVTLPAGKDRVDYEAELGVVVGKQARNVDADEAMEFVEGFTCANDISNRDDQRIEQNWIRGKAFDDSAPVGPVIADPDEVPPDADIRLRVDGEVRQASSRDQFIFSIPEFVE